MDVPWIARVSLASGAEVHLVNISMTGVLMASGVQYTPGQAIAIRLWGPDTDLTVRGRVVRCAANTGASGIRYRVAAAFDERVPRLAPVRTRWPISRLASIRLAELIAYVNEAAGRGADDRATRAFEDALQHLVAAREIRIRDRVAAVADGCEAVYFTVPTGEASEPILQATFEPHHTPRPDELEILEAAAILAGELLEPDDVGSPEPPEAGAAAGPTEAPAATPSDEFLPE
jgi:hypothetical protein